jgi:hypothetical protein
MSFLLSNIVTIDTTDVIGKFDQERQGAHMQEEEGMPSSFAHGPRE